MFLQFVHAVRSESLTRVEFEALVDEVDCFICPVKRRDKDMGLVRLDYLPVVPQIIGEIVWHSAEHEFMSNDANGIQVGHFAIALPAQDLRSHVAECTGVMALVIW